MHAKGPSSALAPDVIASIATLGAVAAGAAIIEAALIPGLLIGAAAVLAPRFLSGDRFNGLADRLRRTLPSAVRMPSASMAHAAEAPASGEPASFDTRRALVKTVTYRAAVTTIDFGASWFVIGELAGAAGLSSLSLVAGPIAYFAHEAAWHFYGPVLARHSDPREATVDVPIPGMAGSGEDGGTHGRVKVSRAVAKTVTYEVVTGVSEFGANYLFVRDLAAAAGLTAFSMVIAPFVYYLHEKAWDYYDATRGRSSTAAPALRLLPAA
jgi:uncharacterized membrane protein